MKRWMTALYGIIVGATMIVPGVSGGSMAMILGIYDELINVVSSFRKNICRNFLFLMMFAGSALTGILMFSSPVSWLLKKYPVPTGYFFLGAVFGGLPVIYRKTGQKLHSGSSWIYILIGILSELLLTLIPMEAFMIQYDNSLRNQALLLLAGVPIALAIVLPGISVSHFLLVLGLYERLIISIRQLDIAFLFPLGIGIVIGIFLTARMLACVLHNYPEMTYFIVFGFVLGSVAELFPGIPKISSIPVCFVTSILGFLCVYFLSRKDIEEN